MISKHSYTMYYATFSMCMYAFSLWLFDAPAWACTLLAVVVYTPIISRGNE